MWKFFCLFFWLRAVFALRLLDHTSKREDKKMDKIYVYRDINEESSICYTINATEDVEGRAQQFINSCLGYECAPGGLIPWVETSLIYLVEESIRNSGGYGELTEKDLIHDYYYYFDPLPPDHPAYCLSEAKSLKKPTPGHKKAYFPIEGSWFEGTWKKARRNVKKRKTELMWG